MHHNPFPWGWHSLAYCVPSYFCLVYCVPPCFDHAYCVSFNNKRTIFWQFHLQKEDIMAVCCVHMYNHSCKRQNLCFCLLEFLLFDIPKSMFFLINAEITPKRRERSERAKILDFFFYFVCDVWCGSLWKLKFLINHLNL